MEYSRVTDQVIYTQLLTFLILLLCEIRPVDLNTYFEKAPIKGTYLELFDTRQKVIPGAKFCALLCSESWSPKCTGSNGESTPGTCYLYKDGTSLVTDSSLDVFLIPRQKGVFHTYYKGGQLFSYLWPSVKLKYLEARNYCNQIEAYLLQFDSLDEYDAAMSLVGEEQTIFFIGANDLTIEGQWVNDRDGSPINQATFKWMPDQPNGGFGQSCAVFVPQVEVINDGYCNDDTYFICERDV